MKLLFICNQNQNRSKTAEELFKDRFETKSAGHMQKRILSLDIPDIYQYNQPKLADILKSKIAKLF